MSKPVGVARRFFAFAIDEVLFFIPVSAVVGAYLSSLDEGKKLGQDW